MTTVILLVLPVLYTQITSCTTISLKSFIARNISEKLGILYFFALTVQNCYMS